MSDTPTREQPEGVTNDRRNERPIFVEYWQSFAAGYACREWQQGNLGPNHTDHIDIKKPRA